VDIDREPEGVAMAFIMLTRRNVAALKSSLLESFPEVGSGHADEALAAGIGFRTHASLLAALKAQSQAQVTVLLSETLVKGRIRELSGHDVDAEELDRVLWRTDLPDPGGAPRIGDWWKQVANQN
jgi:hypothetical protein